MEEEDAGTSAKAEPKKDEVDDFDPSLREQIEELDEAEIVQVIQRPGFVVDTNFDGMDADRAMLLLFKAAVRMVVDEIFGMEDDDWDGVSEDEDEDEDE